MSQPDVSAEAKPVHLRVIAVTGNGAEVVREGEPAGEGTGRDVIQHIYQASLGYVLPVGRGIAIDAGIYPSHIGFESFLSNDNWRGGDLEHRRDQALLIASASADF